MSRLSISSSFLVYCHLRCSLDGNLVKSCLKKIYSSINVTESSLLLFCFLYFSNDVISSVMVNSSLTLCLPKTEISVFQRPTLACQRRRFPSLWRNVCFSHPHVTNSICSHCMMWYTVRKKKCSPLFWYEAIIVWFTQFTMTVVQI